FLDGMRWLGARGVKCFLEVGPDGVLSAMGQGCLAASEQGEPALDESGENDAEQGEPFSGESGENAAERPPALAPVLRGGRPETQALLMALGEMWVCG